MNDNFFWGAYCILDGVLKVGWGLLEGCCIVYLAKGGGYCIFWLFFSSDFFDEIVEEFAVFKSTMVEANAVETTNVAEFAVG